MVVRFHPFSCWNDRHGVSQTNSNYWIYRSWTLFSKGLHGFRVTKFGQFRSVCGVVCSFGVLVFWFFQTPACSGISPSLQSEGSKSVVGMNAVSTATLSFETIQIGFRTPKMAELTPQRQQNWNALFFCDREGITVLNCHTNKFLHDVHSNCWLSKWISTHTNSPSLESALFDDACGLCSPSVHVFKPLLVTEFCRKSSIMDLTIHQYTS